MRSLGLSYGRLGPQNGDEGITGTLGSRGLALPDWQKYYLAGKMLFTCRWLLADDGDLATMFGATQLGSYESLCFSLYRGPKSNLPLTLTIKATIKAWDPAVKLACSSSLGIPPSAPLWMNP